MSSHDASSVAPPQLLGKHAVGAPLSLAVDKQIDSELQSASGFEPLGSQFVRHV
jgi:hypothetical protein